MVVDVDRLVLLRVSFGYAYQAQVETFWPQATLSGLKRSKPFI